MTYRWVDHTAEVELVVEAATPADAFADALRAFAELVAPGADGPPARHAVEVRAADAAALLAGWVEELVFLAETQSLVPRDVVELELYPGALRAVVAGVRDEPSPLVKAVTYHRLEWRESERGVEARLVLDV